MQKARNSNPSFINPCAIIDVPVAPLSATKFCCLKENGDTLRRRSFPWGNFSPTVSVKCFALTLFSRRSFEVRSDALKRVRMIAIVLCLIGVDYLKHLIIWLIIRNVYGIIYLILITEHIIKLGILYEVWSIKFHYTFLFLFVICFYCFKIVKVFFILKQKLH